MTPLLGRPLSSYIFVDGNDPAAVEEAQRQLTRTEITQPAVLTTDLALTRLLEDYGVRPDMVMGHSLGEYGALVAAGALDFEAALEAVSARGQRDGLTRAGGQRRHGGGLRPARGDRASRRRRSTATSSSPTSTAPARRSSAERPRRSSARSRPSRDKGINAVLLPVSHAFHTSIVAPASEPLKTGPAPPRPPRPGAADRLQRDRRPSTRPHADTETMLDLLGRQVASPVQFVRGLHTLYDAGCAGVRRGGSAGRRCTASSRTSSASHDDVLALFTNHPKNGDLAVVQRGDVRALGSRSRLRQPRPALRTSVDGAAATASRPVRSAAMDHPCAVDARRRTAVGAHEQRPVRRARSPLRGRPRTRAAGLRSRTRPNPTSRRCPSRWSSPVRRWGCPAWPTSSTTRTCSGSSTASSSSTPSRTSSVSRWSTCTSPGWSSESPVTRRSRPSTTRPRSSSWRDGTRRWTSSSSSASTRPATPRSTR